MQPNSIKRETVLDWQKLPFVDLERLEQYRTDRYQKGRERLQAYYDYVKKQKQEKRLGEYQEYLKSDQWHRKRGLVLARDKFVCQSCRSRTATDAHHLTYTHLYNEPLFDLIAVCRPCHESITAMDKGLEYSPITHPVNDRIKRAS